MKKFTFSLFLVYFIFLTNLLGTDLSMEIQRVAFKQSKKILKIIILVRAGSDLIDTGILRPGLESLKTKEKCICAMSEEV